MEKYVYALIFTVLAMIAVSFILAKMIKRNNQDPILIIGVSLVYGLGLEIVMMIVRVLW